MPERLRREVDAESRQEGGQPVQSPQVFVAYSTTFILRTRAYFPRCLAVSPCEHAFPHPLWCVETKRECTSVPLAEKQVRRIVGASPIGADFRSCGRCSRGGGKPRPYSTRACQAASSIVGASPCGCPGPKVRAYRGIPLRVPWPSGPRLWGHPLAGALAFLAPSLQQGCHTSPCNTRFLHTSSL